MKNELQFLTLRPPVHHAAELTATSCTGILICSELSSFGTKINIF